MISDPGYYPGVLQVVAGDDFEIYIYFDDGTIHRFDVEPLLAGEAFAPIRDRERFRQTLTVMNGTVAWDIGGDRNPERCLDLDPLSLYRDTPEVDEGFLCNLERTSPAHEKLSG